uniref:Carbonic anhydrase n=1 Tax=Culicoides sonorensis TaxID=179676 RepID=A0A336LY52_CULSO
MQRILVLLAFATVKVDSEENDNISVNAEPIQEFHKINTIPKTIDDDDDEGRRLHNENKYTASSNACPACYCTCSNPIPTVPQCSGQNERYVSCYRRCNELCENELSSCSDYNICSPGCACYEGFARINGVCVPRSYCPVSQICGVNETFVTCKSTCSESCDQNCIETAVCTPGCNCIQGHVRLNGVCVLRSNCPKPPNYSFDLNRSDGPPYWETIAKDCGGKYQTPIALIQNEGIIMKNRLLVINGLRNYPTSIRLQNEGYSITYNPTYNDGEVLSITGGPLLYTYILKQFHLHWGSTNARGSEHTLNDKRYPCEIHFVFWNPRYETFEKSISSPHGLTVINPSLTRSILLRGLDRVINWNDKHTLGLQETFSIGELIGEGSFEFLSYPGSISIPPCFESVTWIVSKRVLEISPAELATFRRLKDGFGNPMVDNFRPVNNRNNRNVYNFLF